MQVIKYDFVFFFYFLIFDKNGNHYNFKCFQAHAPNQFSFNDKPQHNTNKRNYYFSFACFNSCSYLQMYFILF